MRILYKLASRSRPEKFFHTLDNIQFRATHTDYQILATLDSDDPAMFNDAVLEKIRNYPKLTAYYGISHNKINAINRDMELADPWDILVNMSDDMAFTVSGFDKQIIKDMQHDCLLHYPDQAAGKALITLAIMDKAYYDRTGYIYNPEYKSFFCDNEQHEVAVLLGRYKFVKINLLKHNHPAWGIGIADDLYKRNDGPWYEDEALFKRRKAINFGL